MSSKMSDSNPPGFRTFFEVFPAKLPFPLEGELVEEWLGIMVVHQDKGLAATCRASVCDLGPIMMVQGSVQWIQDKGQGDV